MFFGDNIEQQFFRINSCQHDDITPQVTVNHIFFLSPSPIFASVSIRPP